MRAELHRKITVVVGGALFVFLLLWCIRTFVLPELGDSPATVDVTAAPETDDPSAPRADTPEEKQTWKAVGRVRTSRADPIADVRVEGGGLRVHTDAGGRFEIGGEGPAPTTLVFWKEGHRLVTRGLAPGRELDLRLRKLITAEGEVILPGGAPASGVTVRVIEPDDTETTAVTDHEGRFVARNVGEGRLRFVAEPHLGDSGGFLGTATTAGPGDPSPILAVTPGRVITGVVIDPDGVPYPGAECHAKCYYRQRRRIMATDETDAEGRFALVVPEQASTTVMVRTPIPEEGYRYTPWGMSSVEKHEGEIVVDLRHGVALAGHIVAPRGTRLDGRRISAIIDRSNNSTPMAIGTVRDDGTFRVGGLWPKRTYRLRLEGAWRSNDTYILDGASGLHPPAEDVVVRLSIARPFGGRILDADGEPVPSRTVIASKPNGGLWRTMTDEEGRFEIPRTTPGELRVVVFKKGRNQGSHDLGNYRSGDTAVEIRLPR